MVALAGWTTGGYKYTERGRLHHLPEHVVVEVGDVQHRVRRGHAHQVRGEVARLAQGQQPRDRVVRRQTLLTRILQVALPCL